MLPNADRATIPAEKLRDFLLNRLHPQNRGRARLFAALGYEPDDWQRLADDLRAQHLTRDAEAGRPSNYGTTYEIVATLQGRLGSATIKSIWIIDWEADVPRLLTAYRN